MKSTRQYISPEQEQIDKAICDLSHKCTLLKSIWPTNATEECQKFVANQGKHNPQFTYKPLDISKLQHTITALQQLHIIENDPISELQKIKIQELIEKYSLMLAYQEQDLESIYKYNTRLFESIPRDEQIPMLQHSNSISRAKYLQTTAYDDITVIDTKQAQELVELKCKHFGIENYQIIIKKLGIEWMSIQCQNPIKININDKKSFDLHKFIGILRHELDGHMMRYHNGLQTGIHILAQGTGYYTATEEGVASYYKATTRGIEPLYKGLHTMREKCKQGLHSDRAQLCTRIHDNRKVTIEQAFWIALRVKQGIQDTSIIHPGTVCQLDRVYIEGRHLVDEYIDAHGSISPLMIGKVTTDDLLLLG